MVLSPYKFLSLGPDYMYVCVYMYIVLFEGVMERKEGKEREKDKRDKRKKEIYVSSGELPPQMPAVAWASLVEARSRIPLWVSHFVVRGPVLYHLGLLC